MNNAKVHLDETRQHFNSIGFALFWLVLTIQVTQRVLAKLIANFAPELSQSPWYPGIRLGVGFYSIAFPLFLWLMKKIPNGPKGPKKKLTGKQILHLLFISIGLLYLLNLLSSFLISWLDPYLPTPSLSNPFQKVELMTSFDVHLKNLPLYLFIDVFSPIIKEIIFRGVLLDKLRGYGDKRAILFSALAFALFHGGVTDIIYILPMGIIYGYIALRTNTIRYTIILHIVYANFITLLATLGFIYLDFISSHTGGFLYFLPTLYALIGLLLIVIVIGVILFLVNIKKIKSSIVISDEKISKKIVYGNRGMLLFYALSIGLILLNQILYFQILGQQL